MPTHVGTAGLMGEERFVEREGGRISYYDLGGSGPLLVCAPGMGDLAAVYRYVAPEFSRRGYRVIATDLRGMGRSSVGWKDYSEAALGADLLALIRQVRAGPAILVGNSISAGSCVWAASQAPSLVMDLVLVGPFVRDPHLPVLKRLMFRLALARPWGAGVWANYQSRQLYPSHPPSDIAAYRDTVKSNLREPGRLRGFQRMASTNHAEIEPLLGRVKSPALIVMGTADPDFPDPAGEARWVAEHLHGSVVLVEGAGHYPQAEFPEQFSATVLDFLARKGNDAAGRNH
jgi:pimeloyl-ACP methyl ester carboxylesterase